jgi:GxxExxY protein
MEHKVSTKVLYPELSFTITGILFSVHNEIGHYGREKQYSEALEHRLKEAKIPYRREFNLQGTGNIIDFIIDDKILLELKAVRLLTKDHFRQVQNYLQRTQLKLGLLVNFRSKYLKPIRIVRIDKPHL